jgi:putative acetyltransferase
MPGILSADCEPPVRTRSGNRLTGAPGSWKGAAVLIRRELPRDVEAVDEVHRRAFAWEGPPDEPDGWVPVEVTLVRNLRADQGWVPALSLVAEDADGRVIGHVVATESAIGQVSALGLGPLGVLPDHQRSGVGHALMHAVLGAADALGYPAVALLGRTDYYARFGFVAATGLGIGIGPPDPNWGASFQARPLAAYTAEVRGPFRYAAPFEGL